VANNVEKHISKEMYPITSATLLKSSFRNLGFEVMFISDLTPISPKEMNPSDCFFKNNIRAIVKRETHQKEGGIVKRKIMVYNGQNRDDSEFAREMVGSLGAFATTNQWSVENLAEQLKQRNLLVEKIQNKIHKIEQTFQNRMIRDFEQIRAYDKQQIQQLQANFDELQRNSPFNQGLITQHVELIKQFQSRLELTEGTSIEISSFQTQEIEINEKLEIAQQYLFIKVDVIQKCYQEVDLALKYIYIKERESCSTRVKFQEVILLVPKDDVSDGY
jgi:ribosomal protein S19